MESTTPNSRGVPIKTVTFRQALHLAGTGRLVPLVNGFAITFLNYCGSTSANPPPAIMSRKRSRQDNSGWD